MTTIVNYEMTPGWDAGARSIASFSENGSASWGVGQAVGIVCGFNSNDVGANYLEITHGFFIESGKYRIIESGVTKTSLASYATDAQFKIERINQKVRYYINNVLVYTSLINSENTIFVDCSLYAYLDTIIDLVVEDYSSAPPTEPTEEYLYVSIEGSFEHIHGILVEGDLILIQGAFEELSGSLDVANTTYLRGSFELFEGSLIEDQIAIISGSFKPITGFLGDTLVPEYNTINGNFSPLIGKLTSYDDPIEINGSFEPLTGILLEEGVSIINGSFELMTGALQIDIQNQLMLSWPTWILDFYDAQPIIVGHYSPYSVTSARAHYSFYHTEIIGRLHTSSWGVMGTRAHQASYEVILASSAASAQRSHFSPYEVTGALTGAFKAHFSPYEVLLASSVNVAYRLHESPYSISGTLTGAYRIHNSPYEVVLSTGISTAFRSHSSPYQVTVLVWKAHISSWKTVVTDQRAHRSGYTVIPTVDYQFRVHENRYRVLDVTTTLITDLIYVEVYGVRPDYLNISITTDEDSPYWQCEVSLRDAREYTRLVRDTPFLVHLLGVDYHFIVDSRSLDRSIDDEGNYVETCTISGLSPLAYKAKPRATSITKTWEDPIMASAAVEELLGSVTWELVDWMIPAYLLAADNAVPLDVAQQVVQAAGGLIESQPDGSILCRHRWPVSIANLDKGFPDKILHENGIYSASESAVNDNLINRIRIGQDAVFQDQMEYVPNKLANDKDDPFNGILYAFPSPWRDGLRIVTTRPSAIQVGAPFEGVRQISIGSEVYPAENVTFTERESSTRYPIMTVESFEWLDENLGGLVTTPYSTGLRAGNGGYGGYSLGRIEYSTRYLAIPVSCIQTTEDIEAQFLLLEDQ